MSVAQAARQKSELDALEERHAEAQRKALADQARMTAQMEAMQAALQQAMSDKERTAMEMRLHKERQDLLHEQAEAERRRRENENRRSLIKGRFSSGLQKLTSQRSVRNTAFLADMGKLTEARRLWRKCIRQIIRTNRQKNNAVGVLKSRALQHHYQHTSMAA